MIQKLVIAFSAPLLGIILFSLLLFSSCDRKDGGSGRRGRDAATQQRAADDPVSTQPRPVEPEAAKGPVSYDVYIENSASMDGYVTRQGSDFRNDLQGLVKDLMNRGIADTVNLSYVSNTICPYKHHAMLNDVDSFATLNGLKSCKSERRESFMDDIIHRVITTNAEDVDILVSDFIFSSGKGSSAELLTQQEHKMENVISSELARRDFSTIILKFNSGFDGKYYSELRGGGNNSAIDVTGKGVKRPYYVMIFGDQAKMRRLEDFFKTSRFKEYNGYEASYYLLPPVLPPAGKLIRKDRIGDFQVAGAANALTLQKAVADSDGVFQFAVAMNLDSLEMDDRYLMDTASYGLPPNYRLAGIKRVDVLSDPALQGFTHIFLVRTNGLQANQDVAIRLKTTIPRWVDASSTTFDDNPTNTAEQGKTFGFSYLVRGIVGGYTARRSTMDEFAVTVSVTTGMSHWENEEGSGGSHMPWVLIIAVAVIIGVVVVIKNKR
jgi:hypothetical protein